MATVKVYQMKDAFSAKNAKRFTVKGNSKVVIFESKRNNGILTAEVADEDVQKAIEESKYFKNKQISVMSTRTFAEADMETGERSVAGDADEDAAVFEDVSTFREAKAILNGEPYNVPLSKMSNGDAIKEVAIEAKVIFPNLPK